MSLTKSRSRIAIEDIKVAIELLESKYPDLLNHSMKQICNYINLEFNMECRLSDLERYFELESEEDFEKESRKIEYGITD